MDDRKKTKKQLVEELQNLRTRVAQYQLLEAQHQRAEAQLKQAEKRFRNLFDEAPVMYVITRAVGGEPIITDCNALFQKKLGYSLEEVQNRSLADFYSPGSREKLKVFCGYERALSGSFGAEERELVSKCGKTIYTLLQAVPERDEAGKVIGTRAMFVDITERIQSRQALRKSEEKHRALLAALPDTIFRIDREGRFLETVPAKNFRLLTQPENFFGRTVEEVMPPGLARQSLDYVRRALDTGNMQIFEYQLNMADEMRFYECRMTVSEPDVVLAIVRDITKRVRAEEERKVLENRMMHVQKLESIGVLAGGIAHDFNNLLTGILGNAGLALLKMPAESPMRKHLENIEKTAQRAAEMCTQLLAYSGKGKFIIQPINVNDLIREMTHLLELSISKNILLKLNLSPNLPAVEADATQLRQVLMNLITNASDAIGDQNGMIRLTTGVKFCGSSTLKHMFFGNNLPEGRYMYVEISDTGMGMDEVTLGKIFDPFFSTKRRGRGLGLAAVLGIVRGHQGALQIHSRPGKGTIFTVLFPVTDKKAEALPEMGSIDPGWRGSGTVLVVDDEEPVRTAGQMILEYAGFQVLTASDGREALEICRQRGDTIDLVLLDMMMPNLSGKETFQELQRIPAARNARVILSSGYNEEDATHRFAANGLAGFIQKPYQPRQLLNKVREVLEHR